MCALVCIPELLPIASLLPAELCVQVDLESRPKLSTWTFSCLHRRVAAIKETSADFPPTFHSAIQVTIEEKGYSFVLYESYDQHCNAVVQEYFSSKDGHVRLLFHFGKRTLWRMFAPNATYPGAFV